MATTKAKKKKPKKKSAVLNVDGVDLPVTFNTTGRLDKKSQDAFNDILNKKLLAGKLRWGGRDSVLVGTFVGLTVAYRYTIVDLLSPFLTPGAIVAAFDVLNPTSVAFAFAKVDIGAKEKRKERLERDIARAEGDIARVEAVLAGGVSSAIGVKGETDRFGIPIIGRLDITEEERARGEAFIAERKEFLAFANAAIGEDVPLTGSDLAQANAIKWAVAMGFAGTTIYIMQSHTVSDIVEMIPGQ